MDADEKMSFQASLMSKGWRNTKRYQQVGREIKDDYGDEVKGGRAKKEKETDNPVNPEEEEKRRKEEKRLLKVDFFSSSLLSYSGLNAVVWPDTACYPVCIMIIMSVGLELIFKRRRWMMMIMMRVMLMMMSLLELLVSPLLTITG